MIYEIIYEGRGKDKRKLARPVKDRKALMALRDSTQNLDLLAKARNGDAKAKAKLLQLAYNLGHVDGLIAGCNSIGSFFFHDVDLYEESGKRRSSFARLLPKGRKKEEGALELCSLATEGTQEYSASPSSEEIKNLILSKKDEIGLMMLEKSVSGGWHLVCKREPGKTILENQVRVACVLKLEMDTSPHDLQRVCFSSSGSAEDLVYLDDALFEEPMSPEACEKEYKMLKEREQKKLEEVPKGAKKANKHYRPWEEEGCQVTEGRTQGTGTLVTSEISQTFQSPCVADEEATEASLTAFDLCVGLAGLKPDVMDVWGVHNWHANLLAVLSVGVAKLMNRAQLHAVVACRLPNYSQTEDCQKLIDYFYDKYDANKGYMNANLREINAKAQQKDDGRCLTEDVDDEQFSSFNSQILSLRLPQGVKDSVDAVGPALAMPIVTAICPCIGALATGVVLDVHGKKKGLNLIAYIAGDAATGKGDIDPVVEAWMSEVLAVDKIYEDQEEEWRAKMHASKNKKEQPEEPKLPVRCLTLNNTVANLAERLARTEGKHAFSFTPEADTVAQKWKQSVGDFSVMVRQSYDGSRYDREAKSVDAVNVHIEHLLWNVTMCGTPDALYRVVSNYTDGLQSRIAMARTPDNTYTQLEDNPYVLTLRQTERIQQIAHLLPLMQGEIVLPKLEARGRKWLEKIRLETMMNDDRTKARQRIRICVTTQRMTCCLMLCKVCETLIQKHGLNGAETLLKQQPSLWKEMLLKTQTPQMLSFFDVIADSLMENALHFFRERIERAYSHRNYAGGMIGERRRPGKNDTIYDRLDVQFSFEQAKQYSIVVKGADVTQNTVQQMLKNWRNQKLIEFTEDGKYKKLVISH